MGGWDLYVYPDKKFSQNEPVGESSAPDESQKGPGWVGGIYFLSRF